MGNGDFVLPVNHPNLTGVVIPLLNLGHNSCAMTLAAHRASIHITPEFNKIPSMNSNAVGSSRD